MEGEARQYAVGFALADYGYIGTGDGSGQLNDFWRYDPATNIWEKKANFAGGPRRNATGISIGAKGYIGMGTNSSGTGFKKDWWEYDPATNVWTEKAKLPGFNRAALVSFAIGTKGYVGTGGGAETQWGLTNDFWQYDPALDEWTQISNYPGLGWSGGSAFVIGETAYVGTGLDTTNALVNDFWQYNPANDTWTALPDLPAPGRYHAVGFAINHRGYIGTGQAEGQSVYLNDFWEYTPGCAVPSNLSTTNISPSSAKLKWEAVSGATKYKVQYKEDSSGASWVSKTIKATKNAITINNLLPNTSYKWKVRTICGEESSEYSSAQFFTTSLKLENENDKEIFVDVYPNPFSSQATLSFFIAESQRTLLEVFDLAGRKVMMLDQVMEAGDQEIELQREQIGEGTFFIRLTTGNETSVIKIVVQ